MFTSREPQWRGTSRLLLLAAGVLLLGLICGHTRFLVAQAGRRATPKVFAQLGPGNVVRLVDSVSEAGRTIYESRAWSMTDLSVSPSGAYLAVLEWEAGVLDGVNYRVPPRPELILLDAAGHVVRRVAKDVVKYTWCGAQCLACIRGTYAETDLGFFAKGAFLINLSTGAVDSLPRAYQLSWAPFDSSLYFRSGQVNGRPLIMRYELATRSLTPTSHRGLDFSPDGRYYLSYQEGQHTLYDARTDQQVPLPAVGTPDRWVPSGGSQLLLRKVVARPAEPLPTPAVPRRGGGMVDLDYLVYDVAGRRVVSSLHGHTPPWTSPPELLPFVAGGRINVISRP